MDRITATSLKNFFKDRYDISVSVHGTKKAPPKRVNKEFWITVTLGFTNPVKFPQELGEECLRIVYGDRSKTLSFPAGNIERHRISMHESEFKKLLEAHNWNWADNDGLFPLVVDLTGQL